MVFHGVVVRWTGKFESQPAPTRAIQKKRGRAAFVAGLAVARPGSIGAVVFSCGGGLGLGHLAAVGIWGFGAEPGL